MRRRLAREVYLGQRTSLAYFVTVLIAFFKAVYFADKRSMRRARYGEYVDDTAYPYPKTA